MCISLDYAKDPDFAHCVKCGNTLAPEQSVPWSTWGERMCTTCAKPPETKVRDFKVKIGGLLRCCLATLDEHADDRAEEGDVMMCDYCNRLTLVVKDGVWQWNRK